MKNKLKLTNCLFLLLLSLEGFAQDFIKTSTVGIDALKNSTYIAADINGNQNKGDLIYAGSDASGNWIFNARYVDNGSWLNQSNGLEALAAPNLIVADINKDGLVDIIATGNDLNTGAYRTDVYINTQTSWEKQNTGITQLNYSSVIVGDFRSEGEEGILTSGQTASGNVVTKYFVWEEDKFVEKDVNILGYKGASMKAFDANNDGRVDVLVSGNNIYGKNETKLYHNLGRGEFEVQTFNFPTLYNTIIKVSDFNKDGYSDIVFYGTNASNQAVVYLYINNNGNWQEEYWGLENISSGGFDIGDYNQDGYVDIILNGFDRSANRITKLYQNVGGSSFVDTTIPFEKVTSGDALFFDANNDNKLDILLNGKTATGHETFLFVNNSSETVQIPLAPTSLTSTVLNNSVKIFWDDMSEVVAYDVKIGTTDGGGEIINTPSEDNGDRKLFSYGKTFFERLTIDSLAEGKYYYSIQSIGADYIGSDFSKEEFIICDKPNLGEDQQLCLQSTLSLSTGKEDEVVIWKNLDTDAELYSGFDFDYSITEEINILVEVYKPEYSCTMKDTIHISVFELPEITMPSSDNSCINEEYTYTLDQEYSKVTWSSASDTELTVTNTSFTLLLEKEEIITLTVENENGCISSKEITVTPYEVIAPNLAEEIFTCKGDENTVTLPDTWSKVVWQSLNRETEPIEVATYTFTSDEEEKIEVTVTDNNGCIGKDTITLKVWELPVIDLGEDLNICHGDTVTFTTSEWTTTQWTRGSDNTIFSTEATIEWVVTNTDSIFLAVENENGCWSYDTVKVNMLDLPVILLEEVYNTCYQEEVTIEAGDHSSYQWWDINADTLMSEEQTLKYIAEEDLSIKLIATNEVDCESSKVIESNVWDLPSVSLGEDLYTCKDGTVNITLSTGDWESIQWGSINNENYVASNTISVEWDFAINDTIWVQVTDPNGCVNTDTVNVNIWEEPDPGLTSEVFICEYSDLTLEATQEWNTVHWRRLSDDSETSQDDNFTIHIIEEDTIIHTVTDRNGCVGIDTVVVKVYPRPNFDLGNDTLICFNASFSLDVGGGYTNIEWYSKTKGKLATTSRELIWNVEESDSLWAITTNTEGCQNVDSIFVEMAPLPTPDIGEELRVCIGDIVTIDGGNWNTYQWRSGVYGYLGEESKIDYSFTKQDTIWLTVTNENNCVDYDSLIINPYQLPDFSMGDDKIICHLTSTELTIGEDVWSSVRWHSKEKGELAKDVNTIIYTATVKDTIYTEVINENGCVNYDTLVMGVYDLPVFETQGDKEICYLAEYQLSVSEELDSVNWYIEGEYTPLIKNQRFLTSQMENDITYVVEAFNVERCVWYDTVEVKKLELPEFSLGEDQEICYGNTIDINVDREIGSMDYIHWYSVYRGEIDNDNQMNYSYEVYNNETIWVEIGNNNGCVYRDTMEVRVLELPEFNLGSDQKICYLESTTFEVGITSDLIEWSSSKLGAIQEGNSYTHFVYETDTLYAQRTNELGCVWKDSIVVEVLQLPDFEIPEVYEICFDLDGEIKVEGDWQKVEWLDLNHNKFAEEQTNYTFIAKESHTVVAQVTSWDGCISYDTTSISVLELPIAKAGEDKLICTSESTQIGENEQNNQWTYKWFPENGLSDISIAQPIAAPETTTTYYLEITNEKGCISLIDSVKVAVNEFYSVNAGPDLEICIGEGVEIGGYPIIEGGEHNYTFEWNNSESLDEANTSHPMAFPTITTEYIVKAKLGDCLEYQDTVIVTVHNLPTITISPDVSIGYLGETTLEASGGKYYLWAPDYEINSPSISSPTVSPKVTTTYTVQVMTEHGCVDTKSVTVYVGNEVFVPNLFTPNDDGKNDTFHIYGKGINTLEVKVMDQGGKTVYFSDNYQEINEKGWDGTLNGTELPNGTYLWKINGFYYDGTEVKYNGTTHGTINLKR